MGSATLKSPGLRGAFIASSPKHAACFIMKGTDLSLRNFQPALHGVRREVPLFERFLAVVVSGRARPRIRSVFTLGGSCWDEFRALLSPVTHRGPLKYTINVKSAVIISLRPQNMQKIPQNSTFTCFLLVIRRSNVTAVCLLFPKS